MARQGGIHISYLIVAIVICLGLVGVLVIQNGDLTKAADKEKAAIAAKEAAEQKYRNRDREAKDAFQLLHGTDSVPDFADLRQKLADVSDEWSKADMQQTFQSFDEVAAQAYKAAAHWRQEFNSKKLFSESMQKAYEEEQETAAALKEAAREKEDRLKSEKEAEIQHRETVVAGKDDEIARLRTDIDDLTEEHQSKLSDLEKQLWIAKNREGRAKQRIEHLEREIIKETKFEQAKPDGQVIEVAEDLGYAWINIGRRDRLRAGLSFVVFNYIKGGKKLNKGKVEVMNVDEDIAKVRILQTSDSFNPISEGDHIISPFYRKDDAPIFVFAGDKLSSERLSIEEVSRRIAAYGGSVADQVETNTTFVVALDGYKGSKAYDQARQFQVTIMSEKDLMEFIGY